jgi:hypothetical protein
VATISVTSNKTGANTLSATYSGDSKYPSTSSGTISITVNAPAGIYSPVPVKNWGSIPLP